MSNRSERRAERLRRQINRMFPKAYVTDRPLINPRFVLRNKDGCTLGWVHKHGSAWQVKSSVFPFEWEGQKLAEGAKQFDLFMTLTGTHYESSTV